MSQYKLFPRNCKFLSCNSNIITYYLSIMRVSHFYLLFLIIVRYKLGIVRKKSEL